jgi:hypothetical protein
VGMESIRACEAGEILRATQLGRVRRVVEREPLISPEKEPAPPERHPAPKPSPIGPKREPEPVPVGAAKGDVYVG